MAFSSTIRAASAGLAALIISSGAAFAVTVTNQSDEARTVVVDLGAEEPETKIEKGASAKLDCPERCELRVIGSGYGLAVASGDAAVIGKTGLIAYADAK